jgi:hypothetical protein
VRSRGANHRKALGAQRNVVKQGLLLAIVGAVVGTGEAIGVTRYLKADVV